MSCIEPSCSSAWRGALTPEDVQLFYQTAIIGQARSAARARPAQRLRDDAAAHAGVPSRGRRGADAPRRGAAARAGTSRRRRARGGTPAGAASARRQRPRPATARRPPGRDRQPARARRGRTPARQSLRVHRPPGRGGAPRRSIRATSCCAPRRQEEKLAQALARHFGAPVRLEFQPVAAGGAETPALQAQRRASRGGARRRRGAPSRRIPACRGCASASARPCCRTPCGR